MTDLQLKNMAKVVKVMGNGELSNDPKDTFEFPTMGSVRRFLVQKANICNENHFKVFLNNAEITDPFNNK